MARITNPYPDALDNLALTISDLHAFADDLRHTYDEADEADRIYALADDLQGVLNKHRNPPRRGLVRRILGG
jgi:hypothetical protein